MTPQLARSEAAGAEVLKLIEIGHLNDGDVEIVRLQVKALKETQP